LGTLVFDIDPSIMPDWAKDIQFETLNANLDDFFRKLETATRLNFVAVFFLNALK
jgi:hypothetical protein